MAANTGTLAQVGFRARRIEPEAEVTATKADRARAARQCSTFLDRCAAEARLQGWFVASYPRSQVMNKALAALAEHGPMTARQMMPLIGYGDSATEKALRALLEQEEIVVLGQAPTMGKPRIYGLPEEERT